MSLAALLHQNLFTLPSMSQSVRVQGAGTTLLRQ